MNLIDCYVSEIISEPEFKYGKWFVKVNADCYGNISEHDLMFLTRKEASEVEIGHKFLA